MQNFIGLKKFLLWFVLEIITFVIVSSLITFWLALLLIIFSTCYGVLLLRKHSSPLMNLNHMQWWQQALSHQSLEQSLIVLAGVLLFIPGFITDLLAIILLFKPTRQRVIVWLEKKGYVRTQAANEGGHRVIDGEFWREDEDNRKK